MAATFRDGVPAHPDPESLSPAQKFTHFWALVVRFFWKNRCQVRASALAYTTLMALVPLLAVSVSMLALFQISNAKSAIDHWIAQLVQHVAPTLGLSGQAGADASREAAVTHIVTYVAKLRLGPIGIRPMTRLAFAAISHMAATRVGSPRTCEGALGPPRGGWVDGVVGGSSGDYEGSHPFPPTGARRPS